jgi:hypothetical protein
MARQLRQQLDEEVEIIGKDDLNATARRSAAPRPAPTPAAAAPTAEPAAPDAEAPEEPPRPS